MIINILKISILVSLVHVADCQSVAPKIKQDNKVYSAAMHKDIPVSLVFPKSYDSNSEKRFPVVYLLHGHSGNYTDYLTDAKDIQSLSDKNNAIFVCPDGGFGSWYFDSPIDSNFKYETFIISELVTWIDNNYRTLKDKKFRAIGGLSMGGHGALYLAIRHPNVFSAAGSMSGGVDFRPFPNEWDIKLRLGKYVDNKEIWSKNCVTEMINQIPENLRISVDCGRKDFFLEVNRSFHQKLQAAQIAHRYEESEGAHDWDYWDKSLPSMLTFLCQDFPKK